ncbi:MAG: hypothetical protein OXJ52_01635 [Oligoflexia bacterium]|nr:hypothetical protein [Oligoflexia bacterium]
MSKCNLKSKKWHCFLKEQYCQKKNKNWTCIHELKCLFAFKQIETGKILNSICKVLTKDKSFSVIGNTKKGSIEKVF